MTDFLSRLKDRPLPPLFGVFLCYLAWEAGEWYMGIPKPSVEQTGYASGLLVAVVGFLKYYCEMLKGSGRE